MTDNRQTWAFIHAERSAIVEMLETLTPDQWATPSLCTGWSVHRAAAHLVASAEQTAPSFIAGMARSGFRFNTMIERDVRRLGALEPAEIVARIRARTATTNRPPAPVMAMLGEVVVHGEDIRRPLGLSRVVPPRASAACLEMYKAATFPVGGKRRMAGLRLVATDTDWSCGDGPTVSGPALSLMLAMTGRAVGGEDLTGDGVDTFRSRLVGAA